MPALILEPPKEAPTTPATDVGRYPELLAEPDGKTLTTSQIQRVRQDKRRRKETEAEPPAEGRPTGKSRGRDAFAGVKTARFGAIKTRDNCYYLAPYLSFLYSVNEVLVANSVKYNPIAVITAGLSPQ